MYSGSVLAAPLRADIIIIIVINIIIFDGSLRVRIGAGFWGPGHVTYIVPYSALPLDSSMCVLTPRESPPPPPAAILR